MNHSARFTGGKAKLSTAFVLSCGLLLTGCSQEKAEEPVVAVKAARVTKTEIQHVVWADAVLFPMQQAALVPKISAPVKAFYVNKGSKVHKDQLLAVLENKDLAAAQEENKGAYEQAEAAYATGTASTLPEEVQKATSDMESAKQLYDAEQKLYDSRQELFKEGALPRKDLDQATVALTQAKAQYELAQKHLNALNAVVKKQEMKGLEGQLSSARGKYQGAQAQMSYSEIRSPFDGVVTERPLYPGEMATTSAPLMTVMDISRVTARAHISQSDATLLKVGDPATIGIAGIENPVQGKVSLVGPALDPNSTTVEVWVEAANPKRELKPGSSVRIAIVAKTIPNALVVPASAVLTGQDGATSVMVIGADQHAHQQPVKVGVRQNNDAQILEGLQEGQTVATEGAYGLADGTKVTIGTAQESDKPAAGSASSQQKPLKDSNQ